MRILVFSTDDFLPPAGGAEIAFGQIAKRCPDISFDLICARLRPTSSRFQKIGNVTIRRIGIGVPTIDRILLALLGAPMALLLNYRHRYDVIWAILASYGAFAALAVKKITDLPFLLTLQEGTDARIIERRTWWYHPLYRSIFTSATAIQAISRYLLDWGRRMGYTGSLAHVVPNGVDVEAFSVPLDPHIRTARRQSWGAGPDDTVLISVSRFVPKNGLEDVITALASLPAHVRLVLCGDGILREHLYRRVRELGLTDRVHFQGYAHPDDLPELLAAADIFIRPSISEGLGNAFLEAMAAGVIVIGTPVGGIVDFLTDGKTGFVCQPHEPESIVRTVQRVLALDHEGRIRIRTAALAMVRDRFTWDQVVKEMRQIFEKLCPNR